MLEATENEVSSLENLNNENEALENNNIDYSIENTSEESNSQVTFMKLLLFVAALNVT